MLARPAAQRAVAWETPEAHRTQAALEMPAPPTGAAPAARAPEAAEPPPRAVAEPVQRAKLTTAARVPWDATTRRAIGPRSSRSSRWSASDVLRVGRGGPARGPHSDTHRSGAHSASSPGRQPAQGKTRTILILVELD